MNFYQSLLRVGLALVTFAAVAAPSQAQTTGTGAPPAAKTGPISGYMDFHLNKDQGLDTRLDFHRFVLLFNHSFSERIRFVGELELEHAFVEGLEEAGELELEQAYIDFLIKRSFNVRAGMVLVPVGILNERHEPPVYHGVERTFVDSVIVPSTWFEPGVGIHGEIGRGWRYRAYVMSPLDAIDFSADEGIRGGRQKGSDATAHKAAFAGRLEYLGVRGLQLGASVYSGAADVSLRRLDSAVRLGEVDARFKRGRLELRSQYAHIFIKDAAGLNDSVERQAGVSPNVASQLRGFYFESALRLLSAPGREVVAFGRYENFDTQYRMPAGFIGLEEFDRDAWVGGLSYFPDPDVVVKLDVTRVNSRSSLHSPRHSLNLGLGWWF